jgi:hypothetical protein
MDRLFRLFLFGSLTLACGCGTVRNVSGMFHPWGGGGGQVYGGVALHCQAMQ